MKKEEFLKELRNNIQGLPENDINERIDFYSEAIDDRIEEGLSEEEAVRSLGTIDDIVSQIASETSLVKLVKNKCTPKRKISALEIVLLVLGFPLWFPLLIVALALVLVFIALVFILVIVTYSCEIAFIGGGIYGIAIFFGYLSGGELYMFSLGLGFACLGAAILFLFVCKYATVASLKLAKKILLGIKGLFIGGKKNA